jgi:hypothetical protein
MKQSTRHQSTIFFKRSKTKTNMMGLVLAEELQKYSLRSDFFLLGQQT